MSADGGIPSNYLPFRANSSFFNSLIEVAVFVRSYNKTTNRSIVGKQVDKTSSEGELERDDNSVTNSWSAFQASQQTTENEADISVLHPLFREDSKSVAMMKHGMDVVKL